MKRKLTKVLLPLGVHLLLSEGHKRHKEDVTFFSELIFASSFILQEPVISQPSDRINKQLLQGRHFKRTFRFAQEDVFRLCELLLLPEYIICPNDTKCQRFEAMLILLYRLSHTNSLDDMERVNIYIEPFPSQPSSYFLPQLLAIEISINKTELYLSN